MRALLVLLCAAASAQTLQFATSGSALSIGSNCTLNAPCTIAMTDSVFTISGPAQATLTDQTTGTADVYFTPGGVITINSTIACPANQTCANLNGTSAQITCAGACAVDTGHVFPANVLALGTCNFSAGAWTSCQNLQPGAAKVIVTTGLGLLSAPQNGTVSVSIDPSVVPMQTAVPATPADSCITGSWATDGTYFYLCVAPSVWMRAALQSWGQSAQAVAPNPPCPVAVAQ